MSSVRSLRNIGAQSASWLETVGIETQEELEELGAVEAYRRVKAAFPDRVTRNMLYALQGALLDISWTELPADMKETLCRQVEEQ